MQVSATTGHPKRKAKRIELTLPVRIKCKSSKDGEFSETTHLRTVSAIGAGFNLQHRVTIGQLILLTIPMPRQLRNYDYSEQQYNVWAIVRHCYSLSNTGQSPLFHIGVAFIGKYPPSSYNQNPSKLYDLSENGKIRDLADEALLQKHPRYQIPVEVFIEVLDRDRITVDYEITVSENISLGGASILTTLNCQIGDFVRFNSAQYNVNILSVVRNRHIGADGIARLHLEFIDRSFPLEGIVGAE